jgi:hypothetical protein
MLTGAHETWRIRVGDYRVLYEIGDDTLIVLVVRVGHRREIYRGRRVSESAAVYDERTEAVAVRGGRSWTREALANDG